MCNIGQFVIPPQLRIMTIIQSNIRIAFDIYPPAARGQRTGKVIPPKAVPRIF